MSQETIQLIGFIVWVVMALAFGRAFYYLVQFYIGQFQRTQGIPEDKKLEKDTLPSDWKMIRTFTRISRAGKADFMRRYVNYGRSLKQCSDSDKHLVIMIRVGKDRIEREQHFAMDKDAFKDLEANFMECANANPDNKEQS